MGPSCGLSARCVVALAPSAPFHFDATMHKPDHFPSADNAWKPGVRWQTMLWQGQPLGLKFEDQGTVEQPRIALTVFSAGGLGQRFLDGLVDEIRYRHNLQLDLGQFYHRFSDDPYLGPLIDRWRGMRPLSVGSLYEYLVIAIVLQNATVRRSVNMLQALFERYGTLLTYDGRQLYAFWEPEVVHAATEEELRELKVGYRAKTIKRVTAAIAEGEVDEFALRNETREQQRQALLRLYGVGPASVEYILTDVYHHHGEMTHISPWEQKIYSKLFFDTDPDTPVAVNELLAFLNRRFAGYQTLAVHYFWEDLFWRRKNEPVEWLERLIRL